MSDEWPPWYKIAYAELGVREIPGEIDNPRVQEYISSCTDSFEHDELSWCSAFVDWCMKKAGFQGTDSMLARSWTKYGLEMKEPEFGAIVILRRGLLSWQGHVGFFAGYNGQWIDILGGNQNNSVCIQLFNPNRIIGIRWPTNYEL